MEDRLGMETLAPVKIGVVGLGFGLSYMRDHLGDGARYVDIVAVCDLRQDRLDAGRDAFACETYTDLGTMLAEADIEAVVLFSGPIGRADIIRRCLSAGKHVMTTKPFELDAGAATAVLADAKEMGLALFLNSPAAVLGEDIHQIRRWQDELGLGELVFATLECWYWSLEQADGSWYDDPALCPVAPIFRLGIYGINDLTSLAGDPIEVNVLQSRMKTGRPTPDVAQLGVRFANGAIATVRNTWRCRPSRSLLDSEFIFEYGTVRRRQDEGRCTLTLTTEDADGQRRQVDACVDVGRTNHMYRWDLFQRAIRGEQLEGLTTPEQIVAGVTIINAMARAADGNGQALIN